MGQQEITGRLESWFADKETFPGNIVIRGFLYGDTKGRWAEGTWIRTSSVKTDPQSFKEGVLINTLNSVYMLGKPFEIEEGTVE